MHFAPRDDEIVELPPPGSAALPKTPFRYIFHYVRGGYLLPVAGMALLIGISTALETLQPYFLGQLIGTLAESPAIGTGRAVSWFAALCVTWLGGYVFAHLYASYAHMRMTDLRLQMQDDMFGYLHGHAPRYFLDNASGGLVQKIRQAGNAAHVIIDYLCANVIRLAVMFALTITMIVSQAPHLLVPFALFVVVFGGVAAITARRLRHYAKAQAKSASESVGRMVDSVTNWDVVRSFARAAFERETMHPFNAAERTAQLNLRLSVSLMRMSLHVLSVLFLAWLVWESLQSTLAGAMTVGAFTTVIMLSFTVATSIRSLGDNFFVYFEHYGVLSEALSTVLKNHEIVDVPGARPLAVAGGAVRFDRVEFSYIDGTTVFSDFSLSIAAGERVGLVGPSGAGKSTLIKLLRRQFNFQGGRILIDGQDIAQVTWDSLHDRIAEVPQNPSIFHRSVRDNIRYSRPDAAEDEVIAAAKLAHCHDFIAARPEGYDAIVGEKGLKLSGGERQRVAIARAFLKNAPILILDEATSSLDSEAEHLIQEGLLALMKGRTVIAIAHRLSTIAHLDRIVVLDQGRIVEQGTHKELLGLGGTYAKLWQRQAGGFM
ncbi:MAG: ABC transporter ATP-binding protein [Rhodospirillaceae bacterium]